MHVNPANNYPTYREAAKETFDFLLDYPGLGWALILLLPFIVVASIIVFLPLSYLIYLDKVNEYKKHFIDML